jgi:glycerol-3-phosphate cytidylyltransferase
MKIGFIAGAFDLLHAGHIHLLKECRSKCDFLIVGLHVDPSIQRPKKNKPIESILERQIRLQACEYVNEVIVYEKESDLSIMFKYFKINIRFLGSDYKGTKKPITDPDAVPIYYIDSIAINSSSLRERIKQA